VTAIGSGGVIGDAAALGRVMRLVHATKFSSRDASAPPAFLDTAQSFHAFHGGREMLAPAVES